MNPLPCETWIGLDPDDKRIGFLATDFALEGQLPTHAALDDLFLRAYEGTHCFYIATTDAHLQIETTPNHATLSVQEAAQALVTYTVHPEWAAFVEQTGCFLWLFPAEDMTLETLRQLDAEAIQAAFEAGELNVFSVGELQRVSASIELHDPTG